MKEEKARFALGCFWKPQLEFSKVSGVLKTEVGYSGGKAEGPSYEEVCSGETGHAECVELVFDSDVVSYENLLEMFWGMHDPTQEGGQGPDVGDQYRSVIFYFNGDQREKAEKSLREVEKKLGKVQTQIVKAGKFYKAEEYHQDYLRKNR